MIRIEGYADIVRIGQGGLGDVYRATRVSTGGTVAVKILRDVSDESVLWHRTRRELTALVALAGHANVIQLVELLELDQGPALVMEFAPGGSVADLMKRRDSSLTVGETVLVGRQTAAALVAAHAQGIVHRDIKPQNLLIDAYGQVKLCDFGVAAITRSDDFQARTSALSMRYASPEDLDNDVDVGPASDIYSLGATLLHLARGAPPTLKERLVPWEPPSSDDADVAALDAAIAACLHPEPGRRPTAGEVLDELERLGWSVDERQRALAFELPGDTEPAADLVTDPRPPSVRSESAAAEPAGPFDEPTVVRSGTEGPDRVDDTVHRVEAPPRPAAAGRSARWRPWLIAGAVTLLVVVSTVVLWPTDDSNRDGADESRVATATPNTKPPVTAGTVTATTAAQVDVDLVARPAALTDITADELIWPFGPVGDCLVQVADDDQLRTIECSEPHDLQRVLVAELDGFAPGTPYEAAGLLVAVRRACEVAFEQFTGVALASSVLDAPFTLPSAASWAEGDRRFQCLLFAPGRRIVGDAARR